jgi:methyl-accepting chemotaxis protein
MVTSRPNATDHAERAVVGGCRTGPGPAPTLPAVRRCPSARLVSTVALLAATVVLAACAPDQGSDEVAALERQLERRAAAEQALTERVEVLEEELASLGSDPSLARAEERLTGRADDLEAALADVAAQLGALEDRVASDADARVALADDVETTTADLRGALADVRETLDQLTGEAEELRTLYLVLRDRLDRLSQ